MAALSLKIGLFLSAYSDLSITYRGPTPFLIDVLGKEYLISI
jgi:hypothetical protein